MMIVATLGPVTENRATDLEHHLFFVQDSGIDAMQTHSVPDGTRRAEPVRDVAAPRLQPARGSALRA